MVTKRSKADKKIRYDKKIRTLIDQYSKVLVVNADNVGSTQLQQIRHALRGDSVVLMGKNTMMKRSIRIHAEETGNKDILNIIPVLVRNVGLIFTKGDLKEVKDVVSKYKVGAPARVGTVAPDDVVVQPGNTGLDPSQTGFFQVLNIATKINKGTVEILTPVEIIKAGEKVGSSEAVLLTKLGVKPFSYGLKVVSVYEEGTVYGPELLDLTEEDLEAKFMMGVAELTAFSLAISYPTIVAASHYFVNAYKNLLAVAVETEYGFKQAEEVKEFIKDPSKFVVAVGAVAGAAGSTPAAAVEEKKEEEVKEESEEEDGLSGLFD